MASKVTLPPQKFVAKWNEEKVVKWLKRVNLDECIPAFEVRHIDGLKLLDLTEQKLFSYQDLRIKHRVQLAKCVNECKSQASNAKRIVHTIKHRTKSRSSVIPNENEEYLSDDDFDDWDSDFDEDFDDEVEEPAPGEANVGVSVDQIAQSCNSETCSSSTEINGSGLCQNGDLDNRSLNSSVDSLPQSLNGQRTTPVKAVRPPVKRPPSQPPPPPVMVQQLPTSQGPVEDYEIPISHQLDAVHASNSSLASSESSSSKGLHPLLIETYEVVTPDEENYEIIECPPLANDQPVRPILPPRLPPTSKPIVAPPLPHKPKRFADSSSVIIQHQKMESYRSLDRPRLPVRNEEDSAHEVSPLSAVGSTILSNILGRRNSAPNIAKSNQKSKDKENVTGSPVWSTSLDSAVSQSSTPEKDGLVVVGCSQFINSAVSPTESLQYPPRLPPKNIPNVPDGIVANNMATRPLPPVPTADSTDDSSDVQQDVSKFLWFHEVEREDAECQIKELGQNGAFLVRPSKRAGLANPYTVTIFHDGKVFHLNIRQRPDNTYALGREKPKEKTFNTVPDLVQHHQAEPILFFTSRGEPAGLTILCKSPTKKELK